MDYAVGSILTSSPAFLPRRYKTARNLMVAAGLGATIYSLFTNYELGVVRKLSMKTHLRLDVMSGLLLIAAPYYLKVRKGEKGALLLTGMVEVGAGLLSKES